MRKFNKIANRISTAVNGILAFGNEYMQYLAGKREIDYQPFMGHLSDLTYPAALTSLFLAVTDNPKLQKFIPLFWGSYFTIGEFAENISDIPLNGGTYDPKDIACYWAGVGLAYGIHKLSSRKEKNLESKLQISSVLHL